MKKIGYDITKEYENNINQLRIEHSLSIKELAKLIKVNPQYMWSITQAYHSPLYQIGEKTGQLKPWAKRLSMVFNCELHHIFPREICDINWNKHLVDSQILSIVHSYESHNEHRERIANSEKRIFVRLGMKNALTERQRNIIELYYLKEMTYENIGEMYGISRERVRQICCQSLRLLREYCYRQRRRFND